MAAPRMRGNYYARPVFTWRSDAQTGTVRYSERSGICSAGVHNVSGGKVSFAGPLAVFGTAAPSPSSQVLRLTGCDGLIIRLPRAARATFQCCACRPQAGVAVVMDLGCAACLSDDAIGRLLLLLSRSACNAGQEDRCINPRQSIIATDNDSAC